VSAGVDLVGLDELRASLRAMPAAIGARADQIVQSSAEIAARRISTAYARKTGTLADRVRVTKQAGREAAYIVRSGAPHAHLYEKGTRRRTTRHGANRGQMPAAPRNRAMIPIAIEERARMIQALAAMLRGYGFAVGSE
jgi:bacteriophage HK97-gp10 putative tail-component